MTSSILILESSDTQLETQDLLDDCAAVAGSLPGVSLLVAAFAVVGHCIACKTYLATLPSGFDSVDGCLTSHISSEMNLRRSVLILVVPVLSLDLVHALNILQIR